MKKIRGYRRTGAGSSSRAPAPATAISGRPTADAVDRRDGRASAYAGRVRLVAVADTHLFHDELTVPDGDVFVHAGDMCRGGDLDELRENAAWIAALPH